MTTDEHLDMIVKRCHELLAVAEKRTQGEWIWDEAAGITDESGQQINQILDSGNKAKRNRNGKFIASCAGSAEAGWRATIAAIESIRDMGEHDAEILGSNILAAWPIETLNRQAGSKKG